MMATDSLPEVINLPMDRQEFHLLILVVDRFAAEKNNQIIHALKTSFMLDAYIAEYFTTASLNKFLDRIATLHEAVCPDKESL